MIQCVEETPVSPIAVRSSLLSINISLNKFKMVVENNNVELVSPIRQFYEDKRILVSGATGYIGKVLIEKILYSCPNVGKIYLLIRPSRGKSPHERLNEMISQKPFNIRLKQDYCLAKLVAIDSDISQKNLGLSQNNQKQLEEEIDIIFHVAASVKFEAPLEVNMRHNVVATKEFLEFASKFKKLLCFIHVSTAYSNCHLKHIEEKIYKMDVPEDPMKLEVTREMLENRPNTYTYTKAMAENVVSSYADKMNVVVVRPSIVMSALKEPTSGWVDTINGPVGLSVLGALGILQKIKVNSEVVFDLIPVDIVTNAITSIAWASTERREEFSQSESIRVFNLTTGSENPCSFYDYFNIGRDEAYKKPSARALRPLLTIPKQKGMNQIQYYIYKIFSHLLFAYMIDTLMGLFGQKQIVVKAVNRMHHANDMFDYFCSNQWNFVTANVKRLRTLQTLSDRQEFNCNVQEIDWDLYARIGWLGCRRNILKESDETIDYARRRYRAICLLYYSVKLLFLIATTFSARYLIASAPLAWMLLLPIYGIVYLL